jgi:hypothetical protein
MLKGLAMLITGTQIEASQHVNFGPQGERIRIGIVSLRLILHDEYGFLWLHESGVVGKKIRNRLPRSFFRNHIHATMGMLHNVQSKPTSRLGRIKSIEDLKGLL